MKDPYFLTLAGVTILALLYVAGGAVYEFVANWRKVSHYRGQLPEDEFFPAEVLCEILGIDEDRLQDFTRQKMISHYDAEKIIKRLVDQDWWG